LNNERTKEVRKKRKILVLMIVLALAAGSGYRVYRRVTEKKKKPVSSDPAVIVVKAAPVKLGAIRWGIRLTGDVNASTSVQVFPKCPGRLIEPAQKHLDKVRKLYKDGAVSEEPVAKIEEVDEGDLVTKGQIIAVVDHENPDAQVNQAKAALTTAQAQLGQADVALTQIEKDLERTRNLEKEGAASKQALEKMEAEHKSLVEQKNVADARIKQSEAALVQAQIQLAECFITAPISGIVAERYLETGDMAMVTRPLFAIADIDRVEITADLPERYLTEVHPGADVSMEVDAFVGRLFKGAIAKISPTLNVVNRTAELEIAVPNPDHALKPGMFARVTLVFLEKKEVPVIPEAVVLRDESGGYVFIVEKGAAHRRTVALGLEEGPMVEVVEGLRPGEMLVTAGQQKLSEGQSVQVQK